MNELTKVIPDVEDRPPRRPVEWAAWSWPAILAGGAGSWRTYSYVPGPGGTPDSSGCPG